MLFQNFISRAQLDSSEHPARDVQVAQLLREYDIRSEAVDSFVANLDQGRFDGAAAALQVCWRLRRLNLSHEPWQNVHSTRLHLSPVQALRGTCWE